MKTYVEEVINNGEETIRIRVHGSDGMEQTILLTVQGAEELVRNINTCVEQTKKFDTIKYYDKSGHLHRSQLPSTTPKH